MAQICASVPESNIAPFPGEPSGKTNRGPSNLIRQKRGKRIAAALADLLTRLSRCAAPKKPDLGAAPRWFDVVDPAHPWYDDNTLAGHSGLHG